MVDNYVDDGSTADDYDVVGCIPVDYYGSTPVDYDDVGSTPVDYDDLGSTSGDFADGCSTVQRLRMPKRLTVKSPSFSQYIST